MNDAIKLPWKPDRGFDALYGLTVTAMSDSEVAAEVPVRDELLQPAGLVHGGVLASIAESITSMATWFAVAPEGRSAQGLSNQTSFLRPLLGGTIHATATAPPQGAARPGCGRSRSATTSSACARSCG